MLMTKKTKNLILLIAGIQIVMIIGLVATPVVAQAIPGRYRVALQERIPLASKVVEWVIGQVAPVAAIPAPETASQAEQVNISALLQTEPTVAPTNTPVPTVVSQESNEGETAVSLPTSTPIPTPTNTSTPEPLPTAVQIAGVGVVRQSFNNCGPANLTQVLNWYGSDITQEQVAAYLKPSSEDRNVSPWQIADYVNEQTLGEFKALAQSGGSLELIKRLVAAGFPVVIEKGYELPDSGWWGHYLTVFGYDDEQQILYSQDSYLGPWDGSGRTDSYEELKYYWQQFNYTFYVVYRPQQEAEVQAILGEEMVDRFSMWRNVAALAEQETIDTPDYAFAWFNLGSALTELGALTGEASYYQGGAQAYDRAREIGLEDRMLWYQFRPYLAYLKVGRFDDVIALADATLSTQGGRNVEETYWYKGLAQESQGLIADAITSYETALTINENAYYVEWSLNALTGG